MVLTHGKQGVVRFVEETAPGTFPTNPALKLFSKETTKVKFLVDKDLKETVDIADVLGPQGHYSPKNVYGIEVEHALYDITATLTPFVTRNADGTPKSFALEMIPNQDATVKHYYRATGWRSKTVKLSGKAGEAYRVATVFEGGIITDPVTVDPGIGTGSRQAKAAISAALRTWASGAILLEGAAPAILTQDLEFTVDHGTEANWTTGELNPVAGGVTHDTRRIKGTLGYSLDSGASVAWARANATDKTVVIPFGATGQPKLTLTGVVFPKTEVELGNDKKLLYAGQEFMATSIAEGVV